MQVWASGFPVLSTGRHSLHKSVLHLSQGTTNNEERVVVCREALPQHSILLLPHGRHTPPPDFGRENFECSCLPPSTFMLNLRDS